jgi:HSP20 family protein
MFRDLATLQDRMNRLFEQTLPRIRSNQEDSLYAGNWLPAVDIYENDQEIVLKADLPDVNPKDVEVRVEDSTLFLKGERKFENEVKEENFHRIERTYGTFARSFVLPRTVAAEKIAADYKNGVLVIKMPKREESKPKQIKVSVNS